MGDLFSDNSNLRARFAASKHDRKLKQGGKPPREAWIKRVLNVMIDSKRPAITLDHRAEIVIFGDASFPFHGYASIRELAPAAMAACTGDGRKSVIKSALSAAVPNATNGTAAAGIRCWGYRIRIAASELNATYEPVLVQVGQLLNTAGTFTCPSPALQFYIYSAVTPIDVVVLSPSNAGGRYTVQPGQQGEVIATTNTTLANGVLIGAVNSNYVGSIEALTGRDLQELPPELVRGEAQPGFNGMRDEEENDNFPDLYGR